MRHQRYAIMLCLMIGCSSSPKPIGWDCPDQEPLLEVLTFNTGLAPGVVPLSTPRTAPFLDRVESLKGVGIVCLQEVWMPETRDAMLRRIDLPPAQVFYKDTGGEGEIPGHFVCSPEEIDPLVACAKTHCADIPQEDVPICALESCRGALKDLYLDSKPCLHCVIATAWMPTDTARGICTSEGAARAYGGQNGTILLSRWPLKNREAVPLPSSGANRVALLATVEIAGHEPIEVGCMHLSSETHLDPFLPEFETWQDEMLAQFRAASDRLEERAAGRPQLLLGDMNAGPARGGHHIAWPPTHRGVGTRAVSSRVWHAIVKAGFMSPATRAKPSFCTTCADNPLRDSSSNNLIDHVLHRDPEGGTTMVPICTHPHFDRDVPLDAVKGKGERIMTRLSDHYGTVVKYRLE